MKRECRCHCHQPEKQLPVPGDPFWVGHGANGIVKVVADYYGLTRARLMGHDRTSAVSYARFMAMYLIRDKMGWSYPDIGRFMNREHTTILHGVRVMEERVDRVQLEEITRRLGIMWAPAPAFKPMDFVFEANPVEGSMVLFHDIIWAVSAAHNVPVAKIRGNIRSAQAVAARHMAMYLIRDITEESYPTIGRFFARDHSTVVVACQKVEERMKRFKWYRETVLEVKQAITGDQACAA